MALDITYSKSKLLLAIKYVEAGKQDEIITMEAHSGGWDGYKPLPTGKWLIVENPTGNRSYFGLFFQDKLVNDQFLDTGNWRDGIRFGFHNSIGSHGCIMTKPTLSETVTAAEVKWKRIQELIRTKRNKKMVKYQNNENPKVKDSTVYRVSSYGNLDVTM